MSSTLARLEIRRFLLSPKPEVLCLRGKWGTGKTFSWKASLQKNQSEIALKRYSYVSLFGLSSLNDVKRAIFENTIDSKNSTLKPSVESFKKNLWATAESVARKSSSLITGNPFIGRYVSGLESAAFLSVREQIVCFDDLERKNDKLSLGEVFGLASFLKEERGCKVVLVLNDDELHDKEQFDQYFEKVIDIAIEFSPSAEECSKIALPQRDDVYDLMREYCVALGVTNIRVIMQIQRLAEIIIPKLRKFDHSVIKQAIQTLVLLVWSKHTPGSTPIAFIREKRGKVLFGFRDDDEKMPDDEKLWNTMLDKYGFTTLDEFDDCLLIGVEKGYFDEDALVSKAAELNENVAAAKQKGSFSAAWKLFHDSLEANEQAFVDALNVAFDQGAKQISPGGLNSVVVVMKQLGRDKEASAFIQKYIEKRSAEKAVFDLSSSHFGSGVDDPDVLHAFREQLATFPDNRDPKEILFRIAKHSGWNPEDIEFLSRLSKEKYIAIFKQAGDLTDVYIGACLLFDRLVGADAKMKEIASIAKSALRDIASESQLNKMRLSRYSIEE